MIVAKSMWGTSVRPVRTRTGTADPALALLSLVGAAGQDLGGHSYRVARYSRGLATALGLSGREVEVVVWGALFHDLGKVLLPRDLVHKPSSLTEEDRKAMSLHPLLGAKLLASAGLPAPWIAAVAAHHERWDGAGYPWKLGGSSIPLAARILSIADTYDAMTSHRSYRPALSRATAVHELERVAGTQLDPQLTEIFLTERLTDHR